LPSQNRPEILYNLFTPVSSIKGVGPRIGEKIERLTGPCIIDLIWHFPSGILDRSYSPDIKDVETGKVVTLTVNVNSHRPSPINKKRIPYKVLCSDKTGDVSLVFFQSRKDYIQKILPVGEKRVVSGNVEVFDNQLQMTHPDIITTTSNLDHVKRIHPVYPLTEGISQNVLGRIIHDSLKQAPSMPEWLDSAMVNKKSWPSWINAIQNVHSPINEQELNPLSKAKERLAYDELLARQLSIQLVRGRNSKRKGLSINSKGDLRNKLTDLLSFELTNSQKKAIEEINNDMASKYRMLRLLQGDVGSGKTIVALMSILNAIEFGKQAALMAPTEVLAHQHFSTIEPLLRELDITCVVLTGKDKGKSRKKILENIANGSTSLIIGTHALFQQELIFYDLGIAVVDEQQRFGVHQRLLLANKGKAVDVLLMTATPIPRTLMLAFYGELEESTLTEKPKGHNPVDTRLISLNRIEDVYKAIGRKLSKGAKIFWVCPLIEESKKLDISAATDRHKELQSIFGDNVGLIHGQMSQEKKLHTMSKFATSKMGVDKNNTDSLDLLVSTTVIEVGVDIPEASIMVIEHAERFGLSQLHQLRGRIGRDGQKSTCLLLYSNNLGETAKSRLTILRNTNDGFLIAEEDLKLRGSGDLLGTQQSGFPEFRVASIEDHKHLLPLARDEAKLLISRDPTLTSSRGNALKTLLYLFQSDDSIRLIQAG